ncbi:MAG TPA: hypothetical protein VNQ99_05680 [Xanthobacteraceae bacterium]|nr:hypothetical protein [Xanthobacteraceae bacterium]
MTIPQAIHAARERYAAGLPMNEVLRGSKLSLPMLLEWIDGGPPAPDGARPLPPLPRRATARRKRLTEPIEPAAATRTQDTPPRRPAGPKSAKLARLPPSRAAILRRLWRAADLQVREIESRAAASLETSDGERTERERDARTLAVLARTLRELANGEAATDTPPPAATDDPDPIPRGIDEFRRELARRIEAFVGEEPHGGVSDEPAGGVDPDAA